MECRYLNLPGILGWWLNGKIPKRKVIPGGQMHLYDRWIPLVRRMEAMAPLPFGLSLFLAAYKPALPHQYKTDKYKD